VAPIVVPPEILPSFEFHLHANGESVEELHGFLRFAASADGVLFDVGAHHGLFSLVYCAARPGNRVTAFEPAAPSLAVLERAARASGFGERVGTVNAWVGQRDATVTGVADESGFFQPGPEGISIPQLTLDGFVERSGAAPTLLKIDVEGAELEVLRGAAQTLRTARPVVFIELHLDILADAGTGAAEVLNELTAARYRFESPLGARIRPIRIRTTSAAILRLVAIPL
jgi:FkbM family methyltransferase